MTVEAIKTPSFLLSVSMVGDNWQTIIDHKREPNTFI